MATDDLLNELLDRWEELRRTDPAITIEELCADHPELVEPLSRRIEALRRMDEMLDEMGPGEETEGEDATISGEFPGRRSFDDYELIEEIARGGMGVVYKARQRNPNRLVALKMIRPDRFAHPSDKVRFVVEAETAANLSHPNIIRIYKVGEYRGQLYFSMMLFEHGSLAGRIAESAYSEREAASLVETIALAIHAAHQFGILHRDLKPSNILLDAEGRPHVTDFGLAKRIGEDAGATQTGAILGTPCYMSPEQVAGTFKSFTIATDVYGLGAILYELLTGRKPFEGASIAEVLSQVEHKEPKRPRSIDPRIGRDLESICLKCLEKEQSRRYRSAEALAEDIGRWLANKPVHAHPIGLAERSWRRCRSNPLVAGLVGAVAALSIASIIGALVGLSRIVAEQKATAAALKVAREERRNAESRATEAEDQRRLALVGRHSVIHGITEPLKKLADPDLAGKRAFVQMRREIIGVAIRILNEYSASIKDIGVAIDFQIHIGLLRTASDDHLGAWEAYRTAIQLAQRQADLTSASMEAWTSWGRPMPTWGWTYGNRAASRKRFQVFPLHLKHSAARRHSRDPQVIHLLITPRGSSTFAPTSEIAIRYWRSNWPKGWPGSHQITSAKTRRCWVASVHY